MKRLPILIFPLLTTAVAAAEMTMRVFATPGVAAGLVPLDNTATLAVSRAAPVLADNDLKLEMSVFPTTPEQAIRRVQLEDAARPPTPARDSRPPLPPASRPAGQERPKLRLDTALAIRRDDLRWSIADVDGMPDVLSELSWRNQRSLMLSLHGEAEWSSGWLLNASVAAGTLVKGTVQDSDYDGDGRMLEWSRSLGESDDAGLMDLTLSAGRRFRFGPHAFKVGAGYAWHEQNLRAGSVTQVIAETNSFVFDLPPVGTVFDAQSEYTARWYGPRLELGLDLALAEGWALNLGAWQEWGDYKGSGNWALREEFAHPESFTHTADSRVRGWNAILSRGWGKSGRWNLGWEKVQGRIDPGLDVVHFEDGTDLTTRFNEVVWDSELWKLGLEWTF